MYRQFTVDNEEGGNIPYDDKNYWNFLETYQQFSPLTLSSQLSRRRMLGQAELEPYCETVFAAVLFADISGFTRLSARLSEEELKFHINQYFSTLLGVVQQNNGDTIKFCGDAVMIMWSVDRHAEEDVKAAAVLMASLCALQLLGDCGKYDRGEGNNAVSLRLHCGIGCGEVHCMCVGEGSRWEFLISGDPLRQVGLAEPEAGIGEVCISPEANGYVGHKLEADLMPQGSYKLTGGLKKSRPSTAALALLQEEGSRSIESAAVGADSFEFPAQTIDDEDNLFSKDQSSAKIPAALDLSAVGKPPSWLEDISDDILNPALKSKRQVNAKYVPMGARVDVVVHSVHFSQSSSQSNSNASSSVKGSNISSIPASRDNNSAIDMLEGNESDSAFYASSATPGSVANDHEVIGCFTCIGRKSVHPGASLADNSVVPFVTASGSSTPARNSPVGSASASPDLTASRQVTKKKSFIVDISNRMKNGKDSFIFPSRRNSSYRDLETASSKSTDRPFDVPYMKHVLRLDTDPAATKVRSYLTDLSASHFSAKGNPVVKTLSTFNSEKTANADKEDMARILRRFIHEAALKAIESDLFDFGYLAEKRMVVTMFIELIGLDDDFSMGEVKRPQRAMSYALACIKRFEGSLRQYVVDDKGCVLIAAFGLPGSHHEDNSTRAVETAKAIHKSLETMQITCRTGIAMGSVYCGLVGSRARCEYAMMGSSVNLAARLMTKCSPGFILVNDTVYQGASQDFEFQTLEPIQAKGYDNKVNVYAPGYRVQSRTIGLGNRLNQHCKFVGRTEEKLMFQQDLMNFGYGDFASERTSGYIIDGPAGIGKTSLIAEINEMAKGNANISAIIIASASASHMSSSYFVIRQILDVVFTLDFFKSHMTSATVASSNRGRRPSRNAADIAREAGVAALRAAPSESSDAIDVAPPPLVSEVNTSFESGVVNAHSQVSEPSPMTKPVSRAPSVISGKEERHSISSKARTLMKLPSSILDRRFFGMDDSSNKDSVLDTLVSWIEKFGDDVLVSELDPIGAFETNNTIGRANSFDIIYGTGGTGASNIYGTGGTNPGNVFGTGGTSSTNIYGTGGSAPFLGRSRSDMSGRGEDEVFSDEGHLCFPMKTLLPLLSDILPIAVKENSVTKTLTPAMRWRMGDALIVQILKMAMAQEKIVFIVENLQWCDYQSLTVLTYFIRDTIGGLLIGTERPADSTVMSSKVRMRGRYNRMMASLRGMCHITTMRPLFDAEVQRVMEEVVGKDNIDSFPVLKTDESVQHVVRRTSGQPFAVIALCLALKNAIKQDKFVDIDRLSSGVHNIILNRFDQLSNTEKVVLKIASVIGRQFDFEVLKQALMDLNYSNCTSALYHTLEQLADAKLIKITTSKVDEVRGADDSDSEGEDHDKIAPNFGLAAETESTREPEYGIFSFVDQSVQGGIYNLMLEGQREVAHGVIGALFEKKLHEKGHDDVLFAEVVHHYNLSADLEKKLKYLKFAAKNAEESRDYKMAILYNTELIKFATNFTPEALVERCCGRDAYSTKPSGAENAVLHEKISSHPATGRAAASDLHVVRNIFAARSSNNQRKSSINGLLALNDLWLGMKKIVKQFTVTESASKLGVSKEDVCRWISVVADAETRIGVFHQGNNFAIVCLGGMNCSLAVNNTCVGVLKRRLHLKHYPKFTRCKVLQKVLLAYENLAFLQLVRGLPEVAMNSLKMATKILEHSPPVWLSQMERSICRMNGLYSLAYLGIGDSAKAAILISAAQMQKRNHFDAYTNSSVTYMHTFHLAAAGSLQAAFDGCMEATEVLSFIGEHGLSHLTLISAGWYAFMLGNASRAKELYEKVFEYGLSTAHRPLIKMSMELYAAILILSGDFVSANAVLDHLKSPLQANDSSEASLRPSAIKSSLIALSCVLDKRFLDAMPHIQFSCRLLSEIHPVNPVCGLYLFFAAYSALEVLVNVSSLELQERVTANIVLNEAAGASMKALERCSQSIPCLKLMYMACVLKRHRIGQDPALLVISDFDSSLKTIPNIPAGDPLESIPNSPVFRESGNVNSSYPLPSKSPVRSNFSSTSVLQNGTPRSNSSSPTNKKLRDPWKGVGNVGVLDEFALGKLFLHRERDALCKLIGVEKNYKEFTFDSGIMYFKLSRLYHRDSSNQHLFISAEPSLEGANEKASEKGDTVALPSEVADGTHSRQPSGGDGARSDSSSLVSKDLSRDTEEADTSVYMQLDKLRAYEMLQGLEDNDLSVAAPSSSVMKRYMSEKGSSVAERPQVATKPRRLFPIGSTPKISPLIMEETPTQIKHRSPHRRGST